MKTHLPQGANRHLALFTLAIYTGALLACIAASILH
jgi:hypothetical protein